MRHRTLPTRAGTLVACLALAATTVACGDDDTPTDDGPDVTATFVPSTADPDVGPDDADDPTEQTPGPTLPENPEDTDTQSDSAVDD